MHGSIPQAQTYSNRSKASVAGRLVVAGSTVGALVAGRLVAGPTACAQAAAARVRRGCFVVILGVTIAGPNNTRTPRIGLVSDAI